MLSSRNYILVDKRVVQEKDLIKWAQWFEHADRKVAKTELANKEPWISNDKERVRQEKLSHYRLFKRIRPNWGHDDIKIIYVSTVFLGLDHQWQDGPPLVFETMIFNGPIHEYQDRCSTWAQAEMMHEKAVQIIKDALRDADTTTGA